MCQVTKEDWMFLTDLDDPEYEEKINSLLKIYLKRAEEKNTKLTLSERGKRRDQLDAFKYFFAYENWIAVLPTNPSIALTKYGLRKQRRGRYDLFCKMLGIAGIMDDLPVLFDGVYKTGELAAMLVNCFTKLERLHIERHINRRFHRIIISRITNLFLPKLETRYITVFEEDRIKEFEKESLGKQG